MTRGSRVAGAYSPAPIPRPASATGRAVARARSKPLAGSAAIAIALAGCAGGPDFHRPTPPAVVRYAPAPMPVEFVGADGTAPRLRPGVEPAREWWHAFRSPALDALVDEALRHSPTLQAAEATLRQARETEAAQRASLWPTLDAASSATRARDAIQVVQGTLQSSEPLYALRDARVSVSYALDAFGGARRAQESVAAAAEQAAWQREAAALALAGNVVTTAFQIAGLRDEVDATARVIDLQRESLAILRRELELGAIAEVDVRAQEASVAQSEAALPGLRRQLAEARDQLAVLLGRLPAEAPAEDLHLSAFTIPPEIPLSIPARLVERRPDVRAAEAALHGATADVGVAAAAQWPGLALAGTLGSTATGKLFSSGTDFWSGTVTLSQTLFDAGARRHRRRAAVAALDAAGAQYRAAVLTAYQNVADGVQALEQDTIALDAAERGARSADATLAIVRRELALGAVPYLAIVNAEQSALQAAQALAQARTARLADCAALYAALAGDASG